jgi:hypothetical protein
LCITANLAARLPLRVNRVDFNLPDECPLYPEERRESGHCWTSRSGHEQTYGADRGHRLRRYFTAAPLQLIGDLVDTACSQTSSLVG